MAAEMQHCTYIFGVTTGCLVSDPPPRPLSAAKAGRNKLNE